MKYNINKGFIVQKLGDQTIIFDNDESLLYTLNKTAAFIFKKIKSGSSNKEITTALIEKYQIDKNRADKDYEEIIQQLLVNKIIIEKR